MGEEEKREVISVLEENALTTAARAVSYTHLTLPTNREV